MFKLLVSDQSWDDVLVCNNANVAYNILTHIGQLHRGILLSSETEPQLKKHIL